MGGAPAATILVNNDKGSFKREKNKRPIALAATHGADWGGSWCPPLKAPRRVAYQRSE